MENQISCKFRPQQTLPYIFSTEHFLAYIQLNLALHKTNHDLHIWTTKSPYIWKVRVLPCFTSIWIAQGELEIFIGIFGFRMWNWMEWCSLIGFWDASAAVEGLRHGGGRNWKLRRRHERTRFILFCNDFLSSMLCTCSFS